MLVLLKKDLQINHWAVYGGLVMFLLLTYLVTLSPTAFYLLSVFAITFSIYTYDEKGRVNHFLVSMPIQRKDIVKSRYLYNLTVAVGILCLQLIVMMVIHFLFSLDLYIYTWQDIVTLLGFTCLMFAIFTPFFYIVSSTTKAMLYIFILIGMGTVLLLNELDRVLSFSNSFILNDIDAGFALIVEHYFPTLSYVIFILLVSILLYSSFLISNYFFNKKDI